MWRLILLLAASHSLWSQAIAVAGKDDWDDVLFPPGSAILASSLPSLLRLADVLQSHPGYRVHLEGHADTLEAPASAAATLALQRASAVSAFLVKYGARPDQVEISSAGTKSPLLSGNAAVDHFANRRVSITVTDGQQHLVPVRDAFAPRILPTAPADTRGLEEIMKRLDRLEDIARTQAMLADKQRENTDALHFIIQNMPRRETASVKPPAPEIDIRQVGRAFLLSGQKEPPGYGLYSYILFPSKPANDEQKKRYLQVLDAYLRLNDIQAVENAIKLESRLDLKQLHRSMLPVTASPRALTPDALLEVYDFVRAGLLLDNLNLRQSPLLRVRGGPYLACALQPLSDLKPKQRLVQTLDWVPPGELVNAWFQFFLTKAATPRDWNSKSFYQVALAAQTWLENVGSQAPDVRRAVLESMVWFSGSSSKTPGK